MDEEWVKVASVEDSLVAELLLRLKRVNPISPPPSALESPSTSATTPLLFKWRVRQRRSKAIVVQPKNQSLRASPPSPLSFNGGRVTTSVSGGGGIVGFDCGPEEESSGLSTRSSAPKSSDVTRSKVLRSEETNKSRRSRKKLQTLAELKAEEELLEIERTQLQKELEGARDNLEKERAKNENFKRMKMASVHPAPTTLPPMATEDALLLQHSRPNGCSEEKDEKACKHLLPDLNLPLEENSSLLW